jgi:citrate lyase subunit beta/citryl-CoA lyase
VDEAVVHADAVRLSRLGYVGELCIHPRQVEIVNRAYAPAEEDVRWARAVLAGAPGLSTSAVVVDGEMVDEPVLLRARSVLARAVPAA